MRKSAKQLNDDIKVNHKSWEQAIQHHNLAKGNLARVIRSRPEGALFSDIAKLIPDTDNKRVIQLFCNDGRELLSITKTRAEGIGIDFSTNAILLAEKLNGSLKYNCTFHCDEVVSWLHAQSAVVADICFTSLGSLWWIPDLRDYFSSLYKIISSQGQYILWDFHPFVHILDDELKIKYSYPFPFMKRFHESGIIDYVTNPDNYYLAARRRVKGEQFVNPFPVYDYIWSMSAIIEAASAAGWNIKQMTEYSYILGEKYLTGLVKKSKYLYTTKSGTPVLPLTFALVLAKE